MGLENEGMRISYKINKLEYTQITPYIHIGTNMCCQTHFDKDLLNHTAPTQKQLDLGTSFLKHLVDNKIKTYVHCKYGHGRSPMLVAAYFILVGKNLREAISIIRKKRPSIHLEKQLNALRKFEKRVKNGEI